MKQGGFLFVDHRASPGTNAVPGGTILEADTFTCCHCNYVVVMNPERKRERNRCWKCQHLTCDKAICVSECNPVKEGIELALRYPDSKEPFILRGPNGEPLFNEIYKERIF